MEDDGDGSGLVVLDEVHTWACPYCEDLACWCHTSVVYHDALEHPGYSEEDVKQAYDFFGLPRC